MIATPTDINQILCFHIVVQLGLIATDFNRISWLACAGLAMADQSAKCHQRQQGYHGDDSGGNGNYRAGVPDRPCARPTTPDWVGDGEDAAVG